MSITRIVNASLRFYGAKARPLWLNGAGFHSPLTDLLVPKSPIVRKETKSPKLRTGLAFGIVVERVSDPVRE